MEQRKSAQRRSFRLPLSTLFMVVAARSVDGLSLHRRRASSGVSRITYSTSSDGSCRQLHSLCTRLPSIRGGASALSGIAHARASSEAENNTRRERGMAVALFSTYFSVMGAKCALPSVLLLVLNPETGLDFTGWTSPPNQLYSRQLIIGTMTIAFGKLLLGPFIDGFGGIASLQFALSCLALLLATIASCHAYLTFALSMVLVDFIFSSCWAACISAIHQCFPQREWASRVGMLAAAARTGNAAAFSVFASVLHYYTSSKSPWRAVFWVSAVMQLIPISLLTYFGQFYKDSTMEQAATTPGSTGQSSLSASVACLKREAATAEFWLHFISRSALMVFGSFLLFVPTLMTNCYGATSAFGAQTGSIFALGCLLSVTFGSQVYSTLSKRNKIVATISLLGTATLSALAQLAHMKGKVSLSANAGAFLLFLFGFCFAIPFYIPPSLYALSRGGKTSSATIADVFDFGGFGLLAAFNGYVASIQHNVVSAWIPTFEILAGCSFTSLISLALAIYFE